MKAPLYARAGIPEVWLVELSGPCVHVYAEPAGEAYRTVHRAPRGSHLAPAALPQFRCLVEDVVG